MPPRTTFRWRWWKTSRQVRGPQRRRRYCAIAAFQTELGQDARQPIVDSRASAVDAYPISGLTFLMIIPKDGPDRAKRQQLKSFVQYILTVGQQLSQGLDYSPLPSSLSSQDQNLLSQMTAAAAPLK